MGSVGWVKKKGKCPFCGSKKFIPVCPRCYDELEQEQLEECAKCGAIVSKN